MGIRTTMESALHGARRSPGQPASRSRVSHRVAVGALTVLVAAGYCAFALIRYDTFQTSSYDLVIFDQAVRSYAHFMPGISIIKGVHNGFGPHFSVLGDHWSPIIAVLAPLYWIYDAPQTLLVAQAVLFALAIPPLWLFTRRALGGGPGKATVAAYLVSVAYALSWPIAGALAFDFHEVAFVPVLTAVALERLQAGRLRPALIALAALLLVKEDMGLLVAGIGLYLAVSRPLVARQRLVALTLVVAGLAATFIATYVLVPALGGRSGYYWAYTALGHNLSQAAGHLIAHPSSWRLLITPHVKLETVLWLFGAFCFLPLLSPISLAVVPLLLERMLANVFPAWWGTSLQYNAFLVVILLCAAVDGAVRLDRMLARRHRATAPDKSADTTSARSAAATSTPTVALACTAAMCAVAVLLVPRFAFGGALHPSFYHRDAQEKATAAADAVVPAGVTVQAVDNLGPQLSARDTVLLWDGDGYTPPLGAPWIVADTTKLQFTFPSVREQRRRVALLERSGYTVVFARDGYIVLHRTGPATGAGNSREATG